MMIKNTKLAVMLILLWATAMNLSSAQTQGELSVPNERQLAWQQAELGMVFHYDLHVFDSTKYNQ